MRSFPLVMGLFNSILYNNKACRAMNGDVGSCVTYPECFAMRGTASGLCASGLGLCCVRKFPLNFLFKLTLIHLRNLDIFSSQNLSRSSLCQQHSLRQSGLSSGIFDCGSMHCLCDSSYTRSMSNSVSFLIHERSIFVQKCHPFWRWLQTRFWDVFHRSAGCHWPSVHYGQFHCEWRQVSSACHMWR